MNERISQMPTAEKNDSFWVRKLEATTGTLTRVGVGRISTEVVERELQRAVNGIVSEGSLRHSQFARTRINESVQEIIAAREGKTIDQVENSVKPYKMGVEVDDREWGAARERIVRNLEKELQMCEDSYSNRWAEENGTGYPCGQVGRRRWLGRRVFRRFAQSW